MSVQMTKTSATQPRRSTDTEERHLLADTASIVTSIYTEGDRTPRATSPAARVSQSAPALQQQKPYRGFASEQEYLNALHAWADNKRFETVTNAALVGYYGTTTMEEYASRPPAFQGLGLKKKWKARKASKTLEQSKGSERSRTVVA